MPGSASNYAENKFLDHLTGKTAFAKPTAFIGLCTADPTDAGTGASCNECADSGSYARVETAGADWAAAAAGATSNAQIITFPEATGSWGTATHFALFDSGTHGAGNMLAHAPLSVEKGITTGDTPKFAVGELDMTMD